MMQRRTFIHKASFGFLLIGHPDFIPGITIDKKSFGSLAQDIISASGFKPVSILEYDPRIDRIITNQADSLIKMGYVPDSSGYLISDNRKQIISLFSIPASNQHICSVAMVLEKSGKSWNTVHSIDTFEIEARAKAVKAFNVQSHPAIHAENIISMPKLSKSIGIQQKDRPYFLCNTNIESTTAKTSASILLNNKSIWATEFRTDL